MLEVKKIVKKFEYACTNARARTHTHTHTHTHQRNVKNCY